MAGVVITSDASFSDIAKIRHLAGPAPEGCRLTHNERLHLIWLFTALSAAMKDSTYLGFRAVQQIREQLIERGMCGEEIDETYNQNRYAGPVALADAFATHPSLENHNPPDCYLD